MKKDEIQSITNVGSGLTIDQAARQKRYFISMMNRWIALIGALTLPYIAVIAANAGRETIKKDAVFAPRQKRLT